MMPDTDVAIGFQGVSHQFRVASEGGVASLKEWMNHRLTGRRMRHQIVRSLQDVTFAIPRAQAMGIVGRNGAGKSTLLRIAAGILKPSSGVAVINGRVAPVIELGLGFEHELTGRENVLFNGALLGRSQQEMMDRMDEIVQFAELREFIDRPIRTYSTGMVARLAFSVATTVDAQVLLLDEVLSVGDEGFKLKCQDRMEEFRRRGVTILFVSHDLDAVERICDEALWIDGGKVKAAGDSATVVGRYRLEAGGGG